MAKPENVTCPTCDGPMVSRVNKAERRRFWGCAKYPRCKGTRDTDGNAAHERERTWPGHVKGEHEE